MDSILTPPLLIFIIFLITSLSLILLSTKLQSQQKPKPTLKKSFCINHKESRSTSLCHICNSPLCPECIQSHSTLSFCSDHFKLLGKYQWVPILSFEVTSDQNEDGNILQNFKEMIWNSEQIPSYIVIEYRINFEQDLIESHMSYFTREEDQETLSRKFRRFKEQA